MAKVEVILPQMGEGIIEATITRWLVEVNSDVDEDEPLVEIATDKVDSEIPSPVSGKLIKCFYSESEIPKVGDVIAIIDDGTPEVEVETVLIEKPSEPIHVQVKPEDKPREEVVFEPIDPDAHNLNLFIRQFAGLRGVTVDELLRIQHDQQPREISKEDVLQYIKEGRYYRNAQKKNEVKKVAVDDSKDYIPKEGETVVNIDRTRALIAEHMVRSLQTAPHVTSFVEADITGLVAWRDKIKESFKTHHGFSFTYTPILVNAVIKALKKHPQLNVSLLPNNQLVLKKYLNIGVATALPDGNLIVPVVKDADFKSITNLATEIFDLTSRARKNQLKPGETAEGTFTITNLGQTGNISGTPIINQPESAILAVGAIKKKPGVVNNNGDMAIGIRDIMTLSLSYDHRIIDGSLGGAFLTSVAEELENFEPINLQ